LDNRGHPGRATRRIEATKTKEQIREELRHELEVERLKAEIAKYSPLGTRGVGVARAHGYGLRLREYLTSANDQTAVIVQVEHVDAVAQIEAIVSVAGIDAVLVGPYDLSASLGRMGEVTHPDVLEAIDRVTHVCQQAGVRLGIFGVSATAIQPYITRGYTLLVGGIDTVLLGQAAQSLLGELKG
jgi:2-keto-3-deoxy-L-rhamnonate aldolase RhmA